jgi:hypothetical protein
MTGVERRPIDVLQDGWKDFRCRLEAFEELKDQQFRQRYPEASPAEIRRKVRKQRWIGNSEQRVTSYWLCSSRWQTRCDATVEPFRHVL